MNDFCVSPLGDVGVYRYINVTTRKYERPSDDVFELMELYGYAYKGASECFENSIYLFEYVCDDSWHKVQAHDIEEALEKVAAIIGKRG